MTGIEEGAGERIDHCFARPEVKQSRRLYLETLKEAYPGFRSRKSATVFFSIPVVLAQAPSSHCQTVTLSTADWDQLCATIVLTN